jgi:hypothetical protein
MDHDVAIIGGGVTGLYTAYKLLNKYNASNLKIVIFEKSARLGGEIYTDYFSNHILEYGISQYDPMNDHLLDEIIKEFGLETHPVFLHKKQNKINTNKFSKNEQKAILETTHLDPLYALIKYALAHILGDSDNNIIIAESMFLGRELYSYGIWELFSHILKNNALQYVVNNIPLMDKNPNAATFIPYLQSLLNEKNDKFWTISGGFNLLMKKIKDKLRNQTIAYIDHELIQFKNRQGFIELYFGNGNTSRTNNLIFTINKDNLLDIKGFTNPVKNLFKSIEILPSYTINIVIDNPIWNKYHLKKDLGGLPCNYVDFDYDDRNGTGKMHISGDYKTYQFWKSFIPDDCIDMLNHNDIYLKKTLKHYIRNMFHKYHHFNILYLGIIEWSNGNSYWHQRYVSDDTIKSLINIGPDMNIHICGGGFVKNGNDMMGGFESAINTVNNITI